MLEKLAPTLLAGVPSIVKPATASCYVTELCVKIMMDSKLLPAGALQLVSGSIGNMLSKLTSQDVVSFTGSAETAFKLRSQEHILSNSIRFIAEQDSLNASILGPDVTPDTPEFDLFVKEVTREMTTKAGQKCTAIRRVFAPESQIDAVLEALKSSLAKTVIGNPSAETVKKLKGSLGILIILMFRELILVKVHSFHQCSSIVHRQIRHQTSIMLKLLGLYQLSCLIMT